MIVDLSYPGGRSVNNLIPSDLCSLRYPSVDDAVDYILALGRYTQLIKSDLKNTYHILPIHREDRHLLGVCWEEDVYVDPCLPFGLRSAPKIFTAFADSLAWILHHRGVRHLIHYLDDFLIFASPFADEGRLLLDTVLGMLADLRVPVALNKLEGPDTTVTFLGIVIDTARMELRLPLDKLTRLRRLVASWLAKLRLSWHGGTVSFSLGTGLPFRYWMIPSLHMCTQMLRVPSGVVQLPPTTGGFRCSGRHPGRRWISQLKRWFRLSCRL